MFTEPVPDEAQVCPPGWAKQDLLPLLTGEEAGPRETRAGLRSQSTDPLVRAWWPVRRVAEGPGQGSRAEGPLTFFSLVMSS